MKREELIHRFCALSAKVMRKKFNSEIPADCFCGGKIFDWHFSEEIINFIEEAVEEKLNKNE